MKKSQKWWFRSIALTLCMALLMSIFNPVAFAMEPEPDAVTKPKEGTLWQPDAGKVLQNTEGDLPLTVLADRILPEEDAPEVVSAEAIEKNGHVNRLRAQETDLNTVIFQNKDGKKTMYYFVEPVKFVDENGVTRDKKNDVTDLIDKAAYREDYGYVNADNDIKTYFPKTLNANKGVVLEHKDIKIEISPVSRKGVALPGIEEPPISIDSVKPEITPDNVVSDTEADTVTDLTVPTVKAPVELGATSAVAIKQSTAIDEKRAKDTVSFDKVFGADTSIRYTPQFNGFKEDIILNRYTGVNEFTFRVKTGGLSLAADDSGMYAFLDPLTGEVRAQLGYLFIHDSKPFDIPDKIINESVNNPTEEDRAKKAKTLEELIKSVPVKEAGEKQEIENIFPAYNHRYIVSTVAQDKEYLVTVVVDEDYLTDKARVWPVYVDPTISVSGTGDSKAIQDAPIYSNKPTSPQGGNSYNVVGWQGSAYGTGRTLMKFPGLASNSTYASLSTNQITDLSLHLYEGSGLTANSCIDLWQYTGTSWTESTAKCNSVGWDSYSNNFTWNWINCSGWQTFNMTSMVATWKGSEYALDKGIMLKNYTSENDLSLRKDFLSTESGTKPYLTFDYNSISYTTLANGTPVSGNIAQGGEYWYKFTPTICKDYTFFTTGSTDTYGELYQGSTLLQTNDDGGEGNNFSITRSLVPGTEYRLKVRGYSTSTSGSYSVCVGSTDPFHRDNIEYIRVKKYDQSKWSGDGDITSVVTKSYLSSNQYFEAFAPGRMNVAFTVNSTLISGLNAQEAAYQSWPNIGVLPNFYFHLAKLGVDDMVSKGVINTGSAEYYGIWASEANRLLIEAKKAADQIQLAVAAVTAVYAIYNFVSAVRAVQMSMNTTQTYYTSDYRSTAYIADDLIGNMTNNPNSNTAMLGTNANGIAYNQVAQQQGRSYFYSSNYNSYVSQYGSDAMLATNRTFISNAKAAGKTIWFSHDPLAQLSSTNPAIMNSTYTYELKYLQQLYGVSLSQSNIISSGGYWYFVP